MINVIIPMAGYGRRFDEKGYTIPKPLIDVNGEPMFIHTIKNLLVNCSEQTKKKLTFHIGIRQDFYESFHDEFHNAIAPYKNIKFYLLAPTQGQADTIYQIIESMTYDYSMLDPVIIRNCDDLLLDEMWAENAIKYWTKQGCSGGIAVFTNTHPKWSYAAIADGRILYCAEKRVISNFATFGCYYFRNAHICSQAIHEMKQRGDTYNNEYYISQAYNYIKGDILPYFVNNVQGIGTPEDLEMYLATKN